MDIGAHQIAERRIDALVPPDQRLAGELGGDDVHAEMTASVTRTLVPRVPMTFIIDLELERMQRLFQARADALDATAHGRVFRNGRTATSR
jgi:hypothetical protein